MQQFCMVNFLLLHFAAKIFDAVSFGGDGEEDEIVQFDDIEDGEEEADVDAVSYCFSRNSKSFAVHSTSLSWKIFRFFKTKLPR